ncbi:MAG TPA: LysM peptidoglycan-binding domain-containing protein [Burkholderiales bacterium]|nr:LysM peptidoglycan-binding domain-containing protein [Burkholderiales bacterium]
MMLKSPFTAAVVFLVTSSASAADILTKPFTVINSQRGAPAATAPSTQPTLPASPAVSAQSAANVQTAPDAQPDASASSAASAQAVPATSTDPLLGSVIRAAPDPLVEALEPPPPPKYRDLWERIQAGFTLREIDSPLVARHEAWYLNRPEYVQRMIERSRLYLYFVVEELEKRGMPTEIALLPMIESAYNPQAYSRMRAAGMWQFISSTGKKYGLQQNFWYDGRRDVLAATYAALDYLQSLHDEFGNWELALAAYNCGEHGVERAVVRNRARHKPADYFSLKLPRETRNYLPKLQAVKNIISNPDMLDFQLEAVPNQPYFTVVDAPGHMDVVKAAQLADMPVEEFRSLNPAYSRPVIIHANARQILLPIDKVDEFHANLEQNAEPLVTWQTYSLKKGETLEKVAARFNIGVDRLKEVNGITARKRVQPGQMLLVPLEGEDAETNLDDTYNLRDFQASPEEYAAWVRYRVRPGDTLSSIARQHHTSVARIKTINGIKSNQLSVGQRLVVYQNAHPTRHAYRHHVRRVSN